MKYKPTMAASITTLILGLTTSLIYRNPISAGITIAASFFLYKKAEQISNLKGKTDKRKILNTLNSNLVEFAGLATTTAFTTQPITLIAATAAIGLSNSFHTQIKQNNTYKNTPIIQRKERISIISLTLITTYFNPIANFYGLIILTTLVTADLTYSIIKLLRK